MKSGITHVAFAVFGCTFAATVIAGSVTFARVCNGYRIAQKGPDLLIYCPAQTFPWLTYKNCKWATASKDAAGNLTITCR